VNELVVGKHSGKNEGRVERLGSRKFGDTAFGHLAQLGRIEANERQLSRGTAARNQMNFKFARILIVM
jgi:hypothetical protein